MPSTRTDDDQHNIFREKARTIFTGIYLRNGFGKKAAVYARATEDGIFEATDIYEPVKWCPYYQRCALIIGHLEPTMYVKNKTLIERIRTASIKPRQLGRMNSQELFPEHWVPIRAKIESQRSHDRKCVGLQSNQFHCGRCHKNKCEYYQSQTRSADEPMNTFITCLNCGNQWKE